MEPNEQNLIGNSENESPQDAVERLRQQLDEERKKSNEKTAIMEKTIAETEDLAKHLQETTLALAQERQYALARAEKERLLSRWVERINSSFEVEHVLASSIQELGQFLQVDRCGVFIFESDGLIFNEYCHVLWQREFERNEFRSNALIRETINSRETVVKNEVSEEETDDFSKDVQSFLSVPLIVGDELAGVLYAQQCNKPREWNQRDVDLLETTSLPLSTAIEKTRLYKQSKARTAQEELLNRLTTRIRSSLNLNEILARTVKELGIALNVSRCFLYNGQTLTEEYCKAGVRNISQDCHFLILDQLADEDLMETDPIIINDLHADEHIEKLNELELKELKMSEARSALAVPLVVNEEEQLWLVFHSIEPRQWSFDEVSFIESVASQVSVAITQSKTFEKLDAYQDKISRELKQAARVQTALIGGDVFDANLETSVFYKAHSNVSGDFYWIAELSPHVVGVLIGDVSGKGPAAALLTGYLLGEFSAAVNDSPIAWFPDKMINFLCRSILYQNSSSDFYATAWYGVFDLHTGEVRYCNGGHLNPYTVKEEEVIHLDEEKDTGVPLGLLDPKDIGEVYEARSLFMNPEDKMVLFTDGVMDQRMPNGEFVPKDWLEITLDMHKEKSVKEITYQLNEKLNELSGGTPLSDDRLIVCLEQSTFEIVDFNADSQEDCEKLIQNIISECVEMGMTDERAIDLKLGLIEALTNAVRYGLRKNPYGNIQLGYKVSDGSFKMSVVDPGPGFNWQMYSHINIDEVGFEDEGGRGIPLLKEIFDKVTWNPAGNQIGLFFYW